MHGATRPLECFRFIKTELLFIKLALEWLRAGNRPLRTRKMAETSDRQHPLLALSESDLEFVLRLVLASGSLKELAQGYGVSYPTIRIKLDQLLARLQVILEKRPRDAMADLLADLMERGEISSSAAKKALELHRKELKQAREK
jgi:hypothetical protein